jgi:hypothetical protein
MRTERIEEAAGSGVLKGGEVIGNMTGSSLLDSSRLKVI